MGETVDTKIKHAGANVDPGVYRIRSEILPSAEAYLHLLRALGMGWDVTHQTIQAIPDPYRSAIIKHSQFFTKEEYEEMMRKEAEQAAQGE